MSFKHTYTFAVGPTIDSSASTTVVIGPIDVRNYDNLAFIANNFNTAVGLSGIVFQTTFDPSQLVDDSNTVWVTVPTATIAYPATLAAQAASYLPTSSPNVLHWIRVIGSFSSTAVAGSFRLQVGGHLRN